MAQHLKWSMLMIALDLNIFSMSIHTMMIIIISNCLWFCFSLNSICRCQMSRFMLYAICHIHNLNLIHFRVHYIAHRTSAIEPLFHVTISILLLFYRLVLISFVTLICAHNPQHRTLRLSAIFHTWFSILIK